MSVELKEIWRQLRSLIIPRKKDSMSANSQAKLLDEAQAAEFLQPFLLHKNSAQWLASDRQQNPVISFILIAGKPYYAQDDLLEFIDRLIKPAKMYFINGVPAGIDRRAGDERRNQNDRRAHAEIQLQSNVERRRYERPDRRLRGEMDRRSDKSAAA